MANIVVSTSESNVAVTNQYANIVVTESNSNITVASIANAVTNVVVSATTTEVNVTQTATVSNQSVRAAISVANVSGFGNLSYDNNIITSNGIIQYTGVSSSDIRSQFDAQTVSGYGNLTYVEANGMMQLTGITNSEIWSTITTTNVSGYGNIAFDQGNGDIEYTGVSSADIRSRFSAATSPVGIGALNYVQSIGEFQLIVLPTDVYATLSVTDTGGDGSLSFSNTTGVFTYTGPDQTEANARIAAAPLQVRQHISVNDTGGDGSLSYSNTTGVITYVGPDQTEANARITAAPLQVRSHFSAAGNITYDNLSGVISQVLTTDDIDEGTANLWYANSLVSDYLISNTQTVINTTGNITSGGNIVGNIRTDSIGAATNIYQGDITLHVPDSSSRLQINPAYKPTFGVSPENGIRLGEQNKGLKDINTARTFTKTILPYENSTSTNYKTIGFAGVNGSITATSNVNSVYTVPEIEIHGFKEDPAYHYSWGANPKITFPERTPIDTDYRFTELVLAADTSGTGRALWYGQDHLVPITNTARTDIYKYHIGEYNKAYHTSYTIGTKTNRIFLGNTSTTANAQIGGFNERPAAIYTTTSGITPRVSLGYGQADWGSDVDEIQINTYGDLVDTKGDFQIDGAITFGQDLVVDGNLQVQGNIDYVNVEDLLVNDQSITLNYGNVLQDAYVYVDRTGLNNAHLTWNETLDRWEIYDGTSTYIVPRDTTDLSEGTNLYYTDARANAAIDARVTSLTANVDSVNGQTGVVVLDTGDIAENGNLYFTTARANAAMDAYLTSITANVDSVNGQTGVVVLDTDDVAEGATNKYYSSTLFNADFATKTTTDLTEGANLYYTTDRANSAITTYLPNTNVEISSDSNITTTANTQSVYDIANVQVTREVLGAEKYFETIAIANVIQGNVLGAGVGLGVDDVVVQVDTRFTQFGEIFRLTFEDITDANASALNGNVYYSDGSTVDFNSVLLYTDANATVKANAQVIGLDFSAANTIAIADGNVLSTYMPAGTYDYTINTDGRDLTIARDGETKLTVGIDGALTSPSFVYAEQQSNTDIGGIKAFNGGSTISSFNNEIPFVNQETGFLAVQAGDDAANVYSIPRMAMIKLPNVDTFNRYNIEELGQSGGEFDDVQYAMGPGAYAGVLDSKINKRRAVAIPNFGINYTGERATLHATGSVLFLTDNSNVTVRSKDSYGTIFGQPAYTTAPMSNGIIAFRTLQTDIVGDLDSTFPYTEANDFANSTVAFINHTFNIGREDDANLRYSFPKTPGSAGQVLELDANYDLQWATIAGTGTVTSVTVDPGLTQSGNANINPVIGIDYAADHVYTGNITANSFTGEGTDLTGVRALTVELTVKNVSGANIAKGYPLHVTGATGGGTPEVVLADAGNAQLMPAQYVAGEDLAIDAEGRGILTGEIRGIDTATPGFQVGEVIYVAVGGGYANVAPSGEGNIIQNLGIVSRVDATNGGGEIFGAGRGAATPALDSGNIFIGDVNNNSSTSSMNTAFHSHVILGSNNLWIGSGSSEPTQTSADAVIENNIYNADVRLQQFRETVETTANVSGAVSFDVANGSIFKANVVGDITSLALTNAQAGTSATIILTQGATTGTLTAGASWLWAGGTKTLSTTTGDVDIISVVYDGTNYYASLTTGYVT